MSEQERYSAQENRALSVASLFAKLPGVDSISIVPVGDDPGDTWLSPLGVEGVPIGFTRSLSASSFRVRATGMVSPPLEKGRETLNRLAHRLFTRNLPDAPSVSIRVGEPALLTGIAHMQAECIV